MAYLDAWRRTFKSMISLFFASSSFLMGSSSFAASEEAPFVEVSEFALPLLSVVVDCHRRAVPPRGWYIRTGGKWDLVIGARC